MSMRADIHIDEDASIGIECCEYTGNKSGQFATIRLIDKDTNVFTLFIRPPTRTLDIIQCLERAWLGREVY